MNEQLNSYCEQVEMYVLGGLSPEEMDRFENHLQECGDCLEHVEQLRDVVGMLPLSVDQIAPPAGMKQRVLGSIIAGAEAQGSVQRSTKSTDAAVAKENTPISRREGRTRRGRGLWQRIVMGGLSAAVILLFMYSQQLNEQLQQAERQLAAIDQPTNEPMKLNEIVKLNPAADNIVAEGLATIVIDAKGTHLLVQAENLPELKGTQAFQVWLLKDNKPYNAGTFLTQQNSGALYFTFEPREYDMVAITLEPDTQGDTPRGEIVLAASF
jgi:anti-sigma-K factor RskA